MSSELEVVQFDADALVQQAIDQTGFSDFGWMPYREGLEALLETYDRNVQDPAGRQRCRDRVLNLLATRLRCENAFATIPEILEQEVVAPVFITGLPRSGTSALLNLMERAPEFRAVLQWEVQFPDPWRGSKPEQEDPRYQPLKEALAANANSEFSKIHFVDADTPEECVLLHAFGLHGVHLGFEVMLEPYRSWLLAQDLEPLYRYQKQQLQMLSWRNPGKQWLLKAPAHMSSIKIIHKVFPNARFVWCHRDPQKVVPSINSMNSAIIKMYMGDSSHLDAGKMGRKVMDWYAMSLEKGLTERAELPEELFIDCSQQEFVDQPLKLVERICKQFDLSLSEEGRASLQAHIDANPKGKHGKHEYNLKEFGLSKELIDKRFVFYTADKRFPISA